MSDDSLRTVSLERTGLAAFRATNRRGASITLGSGETDDFTPVELLLVAIAGCSAADVDFITAKRSEPETFTVTASGHKIRDEHGNRLVDLLVDFGVTFPDTEDGRRAESVLARSVRQSHDRLCTVSRTVETGTPVHVQVRGADLEA